MRTLKFCLFMIVPMHPVAAQWRTSIVTGSATAGGDARNSADPDHPQFAPANPSTIALSVGRDMGRWRASIDVRHVAAGLTERGASVEVITRGVLRAFGAGFELAHQVIGRDGASTVHLGVGAEFDHWTFNGLDEAPRNRIAARGALEAGVPLHGSWSAVIRAEGAFSHSLFTQDELPPNYALGTAWRYGMGIGVSRKW